jgi:hypothetical protein
MRISKDGYIHLRRYRNIPQFILILLLITAIIPLSQPHPTSATTDSSLNARISQATTTIIVDTSEDLDSGSIRTTCTYTQGAIFVPATDGCTLRRALIEAGARPPEDRPIAITFNLANDDPNRDLEVSGTWTLPIEATLPALDTASITDITGDVTIDGSTQPGGRSDGPPIIIDTGDFSLEIESTGNVISNLAFKNGGVIFLKEDDNTVENIWMGLSDDGASIVFRTPSQPNRMAGGGIFITSDGNTVRNSVISGAFAKAVDIGSNTENNVIRNNLIGTRANGTVPAVPEAAQCLRSLNLDPQNWYGGWGIALSGSNNQVIANRIAGLHRIQTENETPPIAIEIFGSDHEIRDNIIGLDSADSKVGVCGQGIKVSGSGTQIVDNRIVGSRPGFEDAEETAILASDTSPTFGQISVRGNLVEDGPGEIYAFSAGIPQLLRQFQPARITSIDGQTVSGSNGAGSPCPGCSIDLYSDDGDDVAEALSYLGEATADASGNFSLTLSQPLPAGVGIRTSSTTRSAGVIGSYLAGTTTEFSKLYLPMGSVAITGPLTGTVGITATFGIEVTPLGATAPYTYTADVTDFGSQSLTSENRTISANYTWTSPGMKTISITVRNELGEVSSSREIKISGAADDGRTVYLPFVQRPGSLQ